MVKNNSEDVLQLVLRSTITQREFFIKLKVTFSNEEIQETTRVTLLRATLRMRLCTRENLINANKEALHYNVNSPAQSEIRSKRHMNLYVFCFFFPLYNFLY